MTSCPPDVFEDLLGEFRAGRLDEAAARSEELVGAYSGDDRLWNLHAAIRGALGDIEGALAAYARSLEIAPGNARALNNRAILYLGQGRLDSAVADLEAALRSAPGDPGILNSLGAIHIRRNDFRRAEASLRAALAARADFVEALGNLGLALVELGRAKEALVPLERALEVDPGYEQARVHYSRALVSEGRHAEALPVLEAVLAANPNSAIALRDLARTLMELGDVDAAQEAVERALEVDPGLVAGYLLLARLRKFEPGDPALGSMHALSRDPKLTGRDRSDLSFALGRALHVIGQDDDAAFDAFAEANRLRRAEIAYSLEADRALFQRIKARPLDPGGAEGRSPTPIFIVGMPRSGTTLVEQILSSHSEVYGAGELMALGEAVSDTGWLADPRVVVDPRTVARFYREKLPAAASPARFVTDKLPLNFRWVGFIAEAFPEAPIIRLDRHPMAVCWSIFQRSFTEGSTLFGYDLEELGSYYRLFEDLMAHWDRILPGRIYRLDYNALTQDQEAETRRLLDHVGLPFEEACVAFHENRRAVATASALQVRRKMYTGSSDVWKRYAERLGPLRTALGDVLDRWE